MKELLILVDEQDNEIGFLDKLSVHEFGKLHRAFSLFIFNSAGKLLLQQRADDKYHSAGLWSNTCCSHPRWGETLGEAANRRLKEEMGLTCAMQPVFSFVYKTSFSNGLTEHEFDHVYTGLTDEIPKPNPEEVKDWKYVGLEDLQLHITQTPQHYTEWLKICLPVIIARLKHTGHERISF